MKRFLYAAMLASMAITGCGPKKETKSAAVPTEQVPIAGEADMSDEELLAVLDMLDDSETDDSATDEDEDESEDTDEDSETDDLANLSQEEIDAAQEEAMKELAEILKLDQEKNPELAAMGPDMFDPAFDIEKLTPEERQSLLAWETSAIDFARKELEAAAMESDMLGFSPIQFAANSAEIPASQYEALEKNITVARAALAAGRDLVVAGHAERNAANPAELSQKRADALRDAFIAAGLNPEQLHAAGYGEALGEFLTPTSECSADILVC